MSVLEIAEYAYHADMVDDDRPSASRTVLHTMCEKSPAHAKAIHPKLNPNAVVETRREFDVGTVCHQLLLDGAAGVQVIAYDSWRTKDSKEKAEEARAHGLIPLLEKEWALVEDMMAAVRPQLEAFDPVPFTDGTAEQTIVWEENGVLCRARLDWLRHDGRILDDFKTASSAQPEKWSRRAIDYGYDIQAVLYTRGVRALTGSDPTFRFVVIEKEPPYTVQVFQLAPDVLALANRKVDWALATWARCLESGEWPSYTNGEVCWVNLEPWHEARWLEREARWAA